MAQERSKRKSVADQLQDVAILAAGTDHPTDAAVILDGAEAIYESTGSGFEPVGSDTYEETLSNVRQQLDPARITDAWREGKAMSADELVAYAIEFIGSSEPASALLPPRS